MNLLLDTHTLIWWFDGNKRLGASARRILEQREANVWVSAVSIWEISIKTATGRLKLKDPTEESLALLLERDFRPLQVTFAHAFAVRHLPHHHNDPFDHLLIAQAQCENLTLLTADPLMRAYDVRTLDASA